MSKQSSKEKNTTTSPKIPSEQVQVEDFGLSLYQKFSIEKINRVQLKNAPYNPRQIDEKSKKKLQKVIKKNGLVEPLVWNRRTGHLVGGHQRIKIIDSLEGHGNYSLDVAVIDVSEKEEMEANIALNNSESQGEFDLGKLSEMFKTHKLDYESAGYDTSDMFRMFGENPTAMAASTTAENLEEMAENLSKLRELSDHVRETVVNEEDSRFYAVVVFKDHNSRRRWTTGIGIGDERYVDGAFVAEMMKIDIQTPTAEEIKEDEEWKKFEDEVNSAPILKK
jgi:hypothetical protein